MLPPVYYSRKAILISGLDIFDNIKWIMKEHLILEKKCKRGKGWGGKKRPN